MRNIICFLVVLCLGSKVSIGQIHPRLSGVTDRGNAVDGFLYRELNFEVFPDQKMRD